jgi:hypothetical protein
MTKGVTREPDSTAGCDNLHLPLHHPEPRSQVACFISRNVAPPELSLLNIGEAEFPIFIGLIDALKKALALLVLRYVEIEFHDPGAVPVEMPFQLQDRVKSALPNSVLVERSAVVAVPARERKFPPFPNIWPA